MNTTQTQTEQAALEPSKPQPQQEYVTPKLEKHEEWKALIGLGISGGG